MSSRLADIRQILDGLRKGKLAVTPNCETVPVTVAVPGDDRSWREELGEDVVLPAAKHQEEAIEVKTDRGSIFFTKKGKLIIAGVITGWTSFYLTPKVVRYFRYARRQDLSNLAPDQIEALRTALTRWTRKSSDA